MIPGYNHNIQYKGRIYHVQTEDSGEANPHIITHLFIGGNILSSHKTSYADIVKAADLEERVKHLMEDQHKEMLRKLIKGELDVKLGIPPGGKYDPPKLLGGQTTAAVQPKKGAPPKAPKQPAAPAAAATPPAKAPAPPVAKPTPAAPPPGAMTPPPPPAPSAVPPGGLFGSTAGGLFDSVISEKSLDEVILSFLTEDPNSAKK